MVFPTHSLTGRTSGVLPGAIGPASTPDNDRAHNSLREWRGPAAQRPFTGWPHPVNGRPGPCGRSGRNDVVDLLDVDRSDLDADFLGGLLHEPAEVVPLRLRPPDV